MGFKKLLLTLLSVSPLVCPAKDSEVLQPFKDNLFKYGKILENRDRGAFLTIDYREMRDVNGRDEIPVQKAKAERVDTAVTQAQRAITVSHDKGQIETYEVGDPDGAKFAVIFIHGGGGDKTLGANDWTFGGNFNRVKNLAQRNGGVYYSPSVTFDERGEAGVAAIIDRVRAQSPEAKIVVACGSAGGDICRRLANSEEHAPKLSGLVLLGVAGSPENYPETPAYRQGVPIVYAHGSRDSVVPWDVLHSQYQAIKRKNKDYPARFLLFNRGNHGTPIRMIDWRDTLNWIFQKAPEAQAAEVKLPKHPPIPVFRSRPQDEGGQSDSGESGGGLSAQ